MADVHDATIDSYPDGAEHTELNRYIDRRLSRSLVAARHPRHIFTHSPADRAAVVHQPCDTTGMAGSLRTQKTGPPLNSGLPIDRV